MSNEGGMERGLGLMKIVGSWRWVVSREEEEEGKVIAMSDEQ